MSAWYLQHPGYEQEDFTSFIWQLISDLIF